MQTLLRGARVLQPGGSLDRADVLVESGRIVAVGRDLSADAGVSRVDFTGLTLLPGFVDLHVHGGGGFGLAATDPAEIDSYRRWVAGTGVTSFLATVCAEDVRAALPVLETLAAAGGRGEGAELLGINLEGPFISAQKRGALPETWVTPPDPGTFEALVQAAGGTLRLMTIAPEVPGAFAIIEAAVSRGIVVSVGHTDAGYGEASAAFAAGASHITHAFNAMRSWHQREPGPLGAAADREGVTVEVIADGVHLHPATVRLLVRALGPQRVALVTDAVPPAGLQSGVFALGGHKARLQDGAVRLPDGTIAGSAATMDQMVRNVLQWGCADLQAVAEMASATPAGVLGLAGRKGRIAPGYDADMVALDAELRVAKTWVAGRTVFQRASG